MRNLLSCFIILGLILTALGCSGGNTPVEPDTQDVRLQQSAGHCCLGYFQLIADPYLKTLEYIQLREGTMHLNALQFLEPPPLVNLSLESLEFNGNIVEAGIGLRHPFLGLNEFSGFDVCGILITSGSKADFDDPDLRMAISADTRLLNPDGWTRWWNPSEFPFDGSMFSYKDGILGTPDSTGQYNCTLNAYKFFCDSLVDPTDEVGSLDPADRCLFSAGAKNVRHYTIELGTEGLVFNYAVDACWEFPQGQFPWEAPDDFSEGANRPEAWHISISEIENSLWNSGEGNGGDLSLLIDIWDHFHADLNNVKIESHGNFPSLSESNSVGGGDGYSTYQIDITDATPAEDLIELFISVESDASGYGGALPGKPVTAYFTHIVPVSSEEPPPEFHEHWAGVGYNHANISQNPNEQSLDLFAQSTVWINSTTGSPGFKPAGLAIADNKVFYTSQTGGGYYWPNTNMRVHCLDLADGHEIWSQYINPASENGGRFQTSPFWYDDKVYVGGDLLRCFDDETGNLIWEYDASPSTNLCSYPNHSPKVLDGKVYCTSRASLFVCLDANTGVELWTYDVPMYEMMPGTDGERVYYPSNTTLYCNDCLTGELLWSAPIPGNAAAWNGPVVYGDRVYQSGWNGFINCYDKYTGEMDWSYQLPGSGYALNSAPIPFTDPSDDKTVVVVGSAYSNKGVWAAKDEGYTYSAFWNINLSSEYYDCAGVVYDDYIIMPDRYKGELLFLDKMTGAYDGFLGIDQVSAQPGYAYNMLVVATFNSVRCYTTE